MNAFVMPTIGGLLIGLSALIMMLTLGRITGISGTIWEALSKPSQNAWRFAFLGGLILGTTAIHHGLDVKIPDARNAGLAITIISGFLVGFGTKMGSGCTSGHGVCGVGRLSKRSIVATVTFMTIGIITVSLIRHGLPLGGLQ